MALSDVLTKHLGSKNVFFKFREYVSRTLLQGFQPPTNVSLIFNRFQKTLGSALLSLVIQYVSMLRVIETKTFEPYHDHRS